MNAGFQPSTVGRLTSPMDPSILYGIFVEPFFFGTWVQPTWKKHPSRNKVVINRVIKTNKSMLHRVFSHVDHGILLEAVSMFHHAC